MLQQGWFARLGPLFALFAVYLISAQLGLALDPVGGFATLVWAPTGLALGSLVLFGPQLWPAITAAAFVVNAWSGAPWLVALGIAAGNTLEAVLGARILLRSRDTASPIVGLRAALALLVAALASPLVSASVGVLSLWCGGVIGARRLPETWQAWWLGDVLGALVVAPVLLNWSSAPLGGSPRRTGERALLSGAVLGWAALSFSGDSSMPLRRPHMIFPVLIWAALRFGPRAASLSVLAASVVGVGFTIFGVGPYSGGALHQDLLGLQGFMANAAVTSLFLAAAAAEAAQALEASRAERRALEDALGVRDEFLSIASHELRTPLTALALQVTGIERALRERPPPSELNRGELERATRAVSQVGRLRRVVDQLLDVSRISSGRLHLELQSVDLPQLARQVVSNLSEAATRAGCTVDVAAPPTLTGTWDRFRLEQVLTNLLTNAFKYAAGTQVEVSVSAAPARAVLRVSDQGSGIAPEALERIFERFERVATEHQRKSLGVGLYIARRVVEAHSGSIRAESTLGVGSSFIVELPL